MIGVGLGFAVVVADTGAVGGVDGISAKKQNGRNKWGGVTYEKVIKKRLASTMGYMAVCGHMARAVTFRPIRARAQSTRESCMFTRAYGCGINKQRQGCLFTRAPAVSRSDAMFTSNRKLPLAVCPHTLSLYYASTDIDNLRCAIVFHEQRPDEMNGLKNNMFCEAKDEESGWRWSCQTLLWSLR